MAGEWDGMLAWSSWFKTVRLFLFLDYVCFIQLIALGHFWLIFKNRNSQSACLCVTSPHKGTIVNATSPHLCSGSLLYVCIYSCIQGVPISGFFGQGLQFQRVTISTIYFSFHFYPIFPHWGIHSSQQHRYINHQYEDLYDAI